jgi:hypothetical protein
MPPLKTSPLICELCCAWHKAIRLSLGQLLSISALPGSPLSPGVADRLKVEISIFMYCRLRRLGCLKRIVQ